MTKPFELTDAMAETGIAAANYRCRCGEDFDDYYAKLLIAAAIDASGLVEENARLREDLDIWKSVFPDIAPENVLPDRSTLEAENVRLREALRLYGDRIAMANAPPHLQQEIDRALGDQYD